MDGWKGVLVWILIIGGIALYSSSKSREDATTYDGGRSYSYSSESDDKTIDRDEAIYEHWDEIKDYASGSETIEACSQSGCYDLDAEISNGQVELIYFLNGGYLYFAADIDEGGNASDYDQDGNAWDFSVDMDSSTIEDAISDWASDNGYVID